MTKNDQPWKASVTLPPDQAVTLLDHLDELDGFDPLSLSAYEVEEDVLWELECLFPTEPHLSEIETAFGQNFAGKIEISQLPDENWVEKGLEHLKPISQGRFYIRGSHHPRQPNANMFDLQIEAGQAFGTGHHATTLGCLSALETIFKSRTPQRVLDLGCGTGILAMAASRLGARHVLATDIDPLAIETARGVARLNELHNQIHFEVAAGFSHLSIAWAAPFDLIIANILARPLVFLATEFAENTAPGGMVVLSGLLKSQERYVLAAFIDRGFRLSLRAPLDEWMTLVLER